jgi:type III restriction enzyme
VEFTATPSADPRSGSNVLFRASAAEVKAAQMIKLPIILTEHPDWRAAVHDAIETRAQLADTAKSDARYIRPLDAVSGAGQGAGSHRRGPEKVPDRQREHRARTGSPSPPANSASWIASIFSTRLPGRIHHHRGSPQGRLGLLFRLCAVFRGQHRQRHRHRAASGRVLRMPYAQTRSQEALNRAYAHVSSPRFGEGARSACRYSG